MKKKVTKLDTESNWTSYLASITSVASSTFYNGLSYGNYFGNLAGFVTGMIDKELIKNHITSKHYLSTTSFYAGVHMNAATQISKIFPSYTPYIYASAIGSTMLLSKYGPDFLNYNNKVDKSIANLNLVNQLIYKGDIHDLEKIQITYKDNKTDAAKLIIHNIKEIAGMQLIQNIVGNSVLTIIPIVCSHYLPKYLNPYLPECISRYFSKYLSLDLPLYFAKLENLNSNDTTNMLPLVKDRIKQYLVMEVIQAINPILSLLMIKQNSYMSYKLNESMNSNIIFNKDCEQALLEMEESKEKISQLPGSLSYTYAAGHTATQNFIFKEFSEYNAVKIMIEYMPTLIILPFYASLFKIKLTELELKINEEKNKLTQKYDYKKSALQHDYVQNFQNAALINAKDLIKDKIYTLEQNKLQSTTNYDIKLLLLQLINRVIVTTHNTIEIILKSTKIIYKLMRAEESNFIELQAQNVANFCDNDKVNFIPEYRIQNLKEILKTINNTKEPLLNIVKNDDKKLILDNYQLMKGNQQFLHIKHYEFLPKTVYVITGDNGIGKTTLLKDIKHCLQKPMYSRGEMSLPEDANILYLDQEVYIPAGSTLFEAITLRSESQVPANEKKAIDAEIKILFEILKFDPHANKDNSGIFANLHKPVTKLSGGMQKKLGLMRALLSKKEPDILILDESFNELSEDIIVVIQQQLKKHCPNSIILIVDHGARHHNFNGFYDVALKLTANDFIPYDIKDSPLPDIIGEASSIDQLD